ncbi:MAG: hypothetical protein HY460_02005 [Parcubacteria group bacterium]|nr:hypothetical protein [Parcubacteria group bacterium]
MPEREGNEQSDENPDESPEFSQRNVYQEGEAADMKAGMRGVFAQLGNLTAYLPSRRMRVWGGIILGAALLSALGALLYGRSSFEKKDVSMRIVASEPISVARETTWQVEYTNASKKKLENVEVVFEVPAEVILSGDVQSGSRVTAKQQDGNPGATEHASFGGVPFAPAGTTIAVTATLRYRVTGISSLFEHTTRAEYTLTADAISLGVVLPKHILIGQEITTEIAYASHLSSALPDIEIRAEYPKNFRFANAVPQPTTGDALWNILGLPAGGSGRITFRGVLGESAAAPALRVGFFARHPRSGEFVRLIEVQQSYPVEPSPISISVLANASARMNADFGDQVNVGITYTNTSDVAIRGVRVTAYFVGEIFDLGSIREERASIGSENELIWTGSVMPELDTLDPRETGTVSFSVRIRRDPVIRTSSDKNFSGQIRSVIEAPAVPVYFENIPLKSESSATIQLHSPLTFISRVLHRGSEIENSGPIPPRVGQTTTYTVTWQIANLTNDLEGARVRAALPPSVEWNNTFVPSSARISFNPSLQEVVWEIGDIPAHTGKFRPALTASFQIGITPSEAHVGKTPDLLFAPVLEAVDTFTKEERIREGKSATTYTRDDPTIAPKDGIVQE